MEWNGRRWIDARETNGQGFVGWKRFQLYVYTSRSCRLFEPPFVHFLAFVSPSLPYLLISLHLRSFSSWLASLLLPLSLCLQSYRLYKKKKALCQVSLRSLSLSLLLFFLSFLPSFLCFVFFSPLLLSLFLFITNGITDDSEIFARTICSSVFEHDRETFPRWLRELSLCSCPS